MAQNIPDTQTAFQKAIAIVSKAWPWLTTDKEASAMIVGIIVGVVIGWAVHRYFHKREIDGKNTEIIGLKNTVSFLEREKIGLLTTQGLLRLNLQNGDGNSSIGKRRAHNRIPFFQKHGFLTMQFWSYG